MTRYLLVGDGIAGLRAALAVRERDASGEVTLVGEEGLPTYFRAGLSEWMHGAIDDAELQVRPQELLERLRLRRVTGRAARVDASRRVVVLGDGRELAWDRLLLATGASPVVPPWPGTELTGFFTYRSRADCEALKAAALAQPDLPVVIVGAGILGLELAWDCAGLGVPAVLLVRDQAVGRPLFGEAVAAQVYRRLCDGGVSVFFGEEVASIEGEAGRVAAVRTSAGRQLACSAVVAATGVLPDLSLLDGSGVETDRWVRVDERMRTNVPDIFAAGDVATVRDPAHGRSLPTRTWEPAYWGGRVAGLNMAGGDAVMEHGARMNASLVYDLKYVLLGDAGREGPDVEVLVDAHPQGAYAHRELRLVDGVIVGATFLEDRRHYLVFRQLIQQRVRVGHLRARLLAPDFDPNTALPPGGLDYYFF